MGAARTRTLLLKVDVQIQGQSRWSGPVVRLRSIGKIGSNGPRGRAQPFLRNLILEVLCPFRVLC